MVDDRDNQRFVRFQNVFTKMINHNTKRPARWLMTSENHWLTSVIFVFNIGNIIKINISLGNNIIHDTRFPPVHRTSMVSNNNYYY